MKKKIIILFSFCLIVLISGLIIDKIISKPHLIKIDYQEVMDKINKKETFILMISQTTCPHCKEYRPVLNKVLKDYDIIAYYVEFDTFTEEQKKEFTSYINFESTPETIFLKEGYEETAATRISGGKNRDYIIAKLKSNGYIN